MTDQHVHLGLPPPDASAEPALAAYARAGGDLARADVREAVAAITTHAPALLALANADPSLVPDVLARPLPRPDSAAAMRTRFLEATADLDDGAALRRVLRRLRHRAIVRIALREVSRHADVDETAEEMSSLADAAVEAALAACTRTAVARHGPIRDTRGALVPLVVLGMGKLGGRELNLGSDIDLMFFYGTDDATVGDGDLTAHEAFSKIAMRTTKVLADVTEDGFVFRVDLRLRPEGTHGPLAMSLVAAERYYETVGRTWERAALVRARPIAGALAFGTLLLEELRPFIYRKAVEPKIARELRGMLERSRREYREDITRDVKLFRGGIREAEFFVQALQLIFGGRHPELQTQSTTTALRRLRTSGIISHREATALGQDWAFLRRVEHRIHMRAGYQTHALPIDPDERERFARSMGRSDWADLSARLDAVRARIAALFDSLDDDDAEEKPDPALDALVDALGARADAEVVTTLVAAALPVEDANEVAAHLLRMAKSPYGPFGVIGMERAPGLGRLLLREVRTAAHPDGAVRFLAELIAALKDAWSYDRLLLEDKTLARKLVGLFGATATFAQALVERPETAYEIIARRATMPTADEIREAHAEPPLDGSDSDEEDFVSALRTLRRELILRVGLAHVAGEKNLFEAEARLADIADAQVAAALRFAERDAMQRWGLPAPAPVGEPPSAMVVMALGKLGGRELGFTSDLDLVFFFGSEGETDGGPLGGAITHTEYFARIAQRTLRLLSQPDVAGAGYQIDTRLRPSGPRGPLVQSLRAFERHHEAHGADWERQTLIRARIVSGDATLAALVLATASRLAYETGAAPAKALAEMRGRMETELAGEREDRYNVKLGYGGLVDIEFAAQWLAMAPTLEPWLRTTSTMKLLSNLVAAGRLDPADAELFAEAYAFAREIEQGIKIIDPHREPLLVRGGPIADRIARRRRMRARDGVEPAEVLVETWIRTAKEVRATFERIVAPVGTRPPFPDA